MRPSHVLKARRAITLAAAALAAVLALALSSGASATGVPTVDGYVVTSSVTQDTTAGTTTVTYTIQVPDIPGIKDISHVNVVACAANLNFTEITNGGALVDSDPSTGEAGPLVKWDNQQLVGTTETYSYTVQGLYQAADTTLRIKNGDGYFDHTVQGLGSTCQPQPPTIVPPPIVLPNQPVGNPQNPGDQNVLGQRFHRGTAHIAGASGCQRHAFKVSVRGKHIRKVAFYVDGKRLRKVHASASGSVYSVTVNPSSYKPGSHVVTAKVTFDKNSRPKSKTLRARFSRCVRVVSPAFTG